jgi:hypothetical protein
LAQTITIQTITDPQIKIKTKPESKSLQNHNIIVLKKNTKCIKTIVNPNTKSSTGPAVEAEASRIMEDMVDLDSNKMITSTKTTITKNNNKSRIKVVVTSLTTNKDLPEIKKTGLTELEEANKKSTAQLPDSMTMKYLIMMKYKIITIRNI